MPEFNYEDYLFSQLQASERRRRAAEVQLQLLGADPEEAPLYRRITEQRKALRDLHKVHADLKNELQKKNSDAEQNEQLLKEIQAALPMGGARNFEEFQAQDSAAVYKILQLFIAQEGN